MTDTKPAPGELTPTIIETEAGPVPVLGTDQFAAHAEYTDREHALTAMRKAMAGIDAVAKRYGLLFLAAVGANTDEGAIAAANAHGDGQFVGVALANMMRTPGWAEALAFEVAAREAAATTQTETPEKPS